MKRTAVVNYYTHEIRFTSKKVLYKKLDDIPLRKQDREFLNDIIDGLSYKELQIKYQCSEPTVTRRKRRIFEQMQLYDYANRAKK